MGKTKSIMSWGQLILLFGVFCLFIYAFTQRVTFEKLEPTIAVEGFEFSGNTITKYSGSDEVVEIPFSYSYGETTNFSGSITFNNRSEAFDFLQEHYTTGADGYYDFYNQIYSQQYPWNYDYSIDKPSFVEGRDIQITSISREAFEGNKQIKKIILPSSIERIELFAFRDCSNLEEIEFSEGLKVIGDSSFWGTNLKKLVLPSTVEQIDPYAFFNCNNLETVVLSAGLTKMTLGTFNGCDNLKTVTFLSKNQVYASSTTAYQPFSRCPNLESIYVYSDLLNYYQTTEPWNLYQDKYKSLI